MNHPGAMLQAAPAGLRAGDVIAGKYRVDSVLGQGGMAVVYAAVHLELREPVAIKLLKPAMGENPAIVQRFLREARAAVRIKSEHVARVLDVGTLLTPGPQAGPDPGGGAPYMVMEMLAGDDLRRLSQARGPLPVAEAVDYVVQACEAIGEAHLYGIVHRDLKPANLFVTRRSDGSALLKVLDFGISKVLDEADENLTATTDVLGSPLYMSPEQIRDSRRVDRRADIWALGGVLYKLLTGVAAFRADTASAILARIIADPPTPLRQLRADVPPELEAVIMRCLEKDPDRRYQQVDELVRALLPFAPGGGVEVGSSSVSRARRRLVEEASAPEAASTVAPPATSPGGGRPGLVATGAAGMAGVAVAALLSLGLGLLWTRSPRTGGPATPATASTTALASTTDSTTAAPPLAGSAAEPPPASPAPSASASTAPARPARPAVKGAPGSRAFDDRL